MAWASYEPLGEERAPREVIVPFTLDELWFIQNLVRQHDKLGQVWSREEMRRVHRGILELEALPVESHGSATYPLSCGESVLWLMEQQVPMTLMLGSLHIGRQILKKVFSGLLELDGEAPNCVLRPEVEAFIAQLQGGEDDGYSGKGPDENPRTSA